MEDVNEYYLHPGYIFFSEEKYQITTILGSCVAVCIWDKKKKIGGMNHYIYSIDINKKMNSKYGDNSIKILLNFFKKAGSEFKDLEASIIGGAENPSLSSKIGEENINIAEKILGNNKINVVYKKTGGEKGRKVIFNNYSGKCEARDLGEKIKRLR